MHVETCEASKIDSNSNRTCRSEFDSKVTCRFENFESAAHTVCRHTSNYAHSLFNKNINLCAVCSWDICLQLPFTCSCTAVSRAYTQLPHDNRHWTCKRLPPDSVGDSIRTEISDSQVPIIKHRYVIFGSFCSWITGDLDNNWDRQQIIVSPLIDVLV